MDFKERVEKVNHIFEGKIIKLDVENVLLPNGKKATREIIHHHGAVGIVAITDEDKIVMIRQWRSPLKQVTLEIPAGKIEMGEDSKKTAERELNEEARLKAQKLEKVLEFYTSPGFADEKMYLYHAINVTHTEKELPQDDDEFLNIEELSIEQVRKEIASGTICDAKTIMAIMMWQSLQ